MEQTQLQQQKGKTVAAATTGMYVNLIETQIWFYYFFCLYVAHQMQKQLKIVGNVVGMRSKRMKRTER